MRKILEIDKTRPGVCPEPALAQAQFHLSQILSTRVTASNTSGGPQEAKDKEDAQKRATILEEVSSLAQMARKALFKPHPLGRLMNTLSSEQGEQPPQQSGTVTPTTATAERAGMPIPPEHELALFDHLQPLYDGRFTGLHLLQYLR